MAKIETGKYRVLKVKYCLTLISDDFKKRPSETFKVSDGL
ncbi:hypothetical protein NEIFL0001_0527 [Neisseria flavescens SK114]|nr:hypothetical protein NEIFL0001_0527 [Neisseria flavescens SK114]